MEFPQYVAVFFFLDVFKILFNYYYMFWCEPYNAKLFMWKKGQLWNLEIPAVTSQMWLSDSLLGKSFLRIKADQWDLRQCPFLVPWDSNLIAQLQLSIFNWEGNIECPFKMSEY